MKTVKFSEQEINMLRDIFNKSGELLNRLGFKLDGKASERNAINKEPTQREKIKNYDALLSTGKKNIKPKHLQK
jgi:hypothetical protein